MHEAPAAREADAALTLSVVIPAYNERGRLGESLTAWRDWLDTSEHTAELIVVDDGSEDGTEALACDFDATTVTIRVLRNERNRGKGASVKRGVLTSGGDVILFCDADLNVPASELPRLTHALDEGVDVAIGSRMTNAAQVKRPFVRRVTSWLFCAVRRCLLLPDIRDTQCGFKAFTRESARAIFEKQSLEGYGFDLEVLAIARGLGCTIREVPVHWEAREGSKVRPVRDGIRLLVDIYRVRRRWGRASAKSPAASAGGA